MVSLSLKRDGNLHSAKSVDGKKDKPEERRQTRTQEKNMILVRKEEAPISYEKDGQ